MKKKKVVIIIVVIILIFIGFRAVSSMKNAVSSMGIPVEVEEVKSEKIVSKINAEGSVKLEEKVSISASNSGKVKAVKVKEGDSVKAGDVLVVYDEDALTQLKDQLETAKLSVKTAEISLEATQIPASEDEKTQALNSITQAETNIIKIEYNINQLDLELDQAKRAVEKAQKDYDNNVILFNSSAISQNELDTYKDALDNSKTNYDGVVSRRNSANIDLEGQKANLEVAQSNYNTLLNKINTESNQNTIAAQMNQLEKAKLSVVQIQDSINDFKLMEVAPNDGTVITLNIKEGDFAAEGTPLIEIANLDNRIVEIEVPEYDMANVNLGQNAEVKGDGINGTLSGVVSKISPIAKEKISVGSSKQVIAVEITVEDKSQLRVGYTLKADIITNINDNAVVVPLMSYLTDDKGQDYLYVLKEDNTIERRDIEILTYNNSTIEVSGVNVGDKVVNNANADLLSDGAMVTVNNLDNSANNTTAVNE